MSTPPGTPLPGAPLPGSPSSSWVRELVATKRAPVPWDLAALIAIAVATPLGLAFAFGHDTLFGQNVLGLGVLTSMGALIASIADRGGPAVDRVRRIVLTAVSAAVGLSIGMLALGHDTATVIVVVLAALVSGLTGVISANASQAGLQFLVYAIVGSGIDFGLRPLWLGPLVFLVGALWRLALTGVAIGVRALLPGGSRAPERHAVASVYTAIAAQLDAAGTVRAHGRGIDRGESAGAVDAARRGVTAALNDAYDLMVATRTSLAGRDPRWRILVTLLNAATPIVEAATAVTVEQEPVSPQVPNALRAIARSIEDPHASPPVLPPPDRSTPGRAALSSSLRLVGSLLNGEDPVTMTVPIQRPDAVPLAGPTASDRLRLAVDHLTSGGETWFAILRLVLCVAVAEAVSVLLPLERPYWITLTVAVVMKPDFGSVFARALQRGLGTVVGVLIGAAVVAFLPSGWPQIVALAVLAAAMPVAIRRNYGLFATFITPVIVILLELAHGGDPGIVVSRVTDTLIGSAIVVVVGYLPWPSTWRSGKQLGERVADVATGVAAYLAVALAPVDSRTQARDRSSARRTTYRRLSDLRTRVQQTLAEPPPISTSAATWWPEIVALERVTDAITSTAIRAAQSRVAVDRNDVVELEQALTDLAGAIRDRRPPTPFALPRDELLAPVGAEIGAARSVLSA